MKTKQFFLIIALSLFSLFIKAQDKYEFMIIEFDPGLKKEIQISIGGKEYLEENADYSSTQNTRHNINPLLKKIDEYQDKGWELINMQTVLSGGTGIIQNYFAYLKKKKTTK